MIAACAPTSLRSERWSCAGSNIIETGFGTCHMSSTELPRAANASALGSALLLEAELSWNAAWFPPKQQGFAMGLFVTVNVGASVTKLIGPVLIALVPAAGVLGGWISGGWRFVPFRYGGLLLLMAIAVAVITPATDKKPVWN